MPKTSLQASFNPFVHKIELTKPQKLQVLFMSITIAPIRFLIVIFLFILGWCLGSLFTIKADTSKPASPLRQTLYQLLYWFGRAILFVCGFYHVRVKGKRASYQEAPILLVLPHSSLWDVIVLYASSPMPSPLSKVENFKIPLIGTFLKAMQPILVHRANVTDKHNAINEIKKRLSSNDIWPQLVIFPEGTCTNKKTLLKFKLGAFLAGTSVQPVIIRHQNKPNISTWTEIGPGAFYLIWLAFCQIKLNVEIEYLPVYQPSALERKDSKLYANNVQNYLANVLDVPCSDYSYEDRLLMKQAGKLKLPKEIALVGFLKISTTYNIKVQDIIERLKDFARISSNCSSGIITLEDLCAYLKIKVTHSIQKLLLVSSNDLTANLSFLQYLTLYYALTKKIEKPSNLLAAYEVYRLARVSTSHGDMIQEILDAINQKKLMSEEEFAEFAHFNPFYANLLLQCENDTSFK